MDKIIEKKTGWRVAFTKKALPWWLGALLLVFVIYLIARPNNKTLRVDKDTVTISNAVKGEFNDYIRISGRVQPMTTIQLSPQEGGIVEKILIEEGSPVKAGDAILILNNDNLDLQILNSEAELAEKENILRNTQIQMEQQKLDVRQNVLEYGTNVERLRRAYEQQKALYEDKLIAKEEYLKAEEDYQLALQKYNLMTERSRQDSLYRGTQIDRMEESLENMQLNMSMIRRRKSNLIVKAPIDGELGLLDVVLGQSIAAGTKIGQINSVGVYKVEAQIDEHYIDRVVAGLEATFERQGETYSTVIRKVYPEVRDGKFKADFKFDGEQPDNIRSGQTYYLNLQLGQPEEAVIIPRGTFYQKTGGKWIYVVNKDGNKAVKREIRIGRQNPQYYEVLEGLEPGEKVITSGYDTYGDSDVLVLGYEEFWNFLKKNKLYGAINLVGLTVSMAFVLLLAVYIQRQLSTDSFQQNADRIYVIANEDNVTMGYWLDKHLKNNFPEIEKGCCVANIASAAAFNINGERVYGSTMAADSTFFEMFSYDLLEGNKADWRVSQDRCMVSREFANAHFGDKDPLGQIISFN